MRARKSGRSRNPCHTGKTNLIRPCLYILATTAIAQQAADKGRFLNMRHENRMTENGGKGRRKWSGRLDLNQRPHAPQACALPGCATSRPIALHHVCCSPPLQRRGFCANSKKIPASKDAGYSNSATLPAYHSDSRTVNKERSESRRSSKVLRLSDSSCGDIACGEDSLPRTSASAATAPPFVPFVPCA